MTPANRALFLCCFAFFSLGHLNFLHASHACPVATCAHFSGENTFSVPLQWRREMDDFSISIWAYTKRGGETRIFDIELSNGKRLQTLVGAAFLPQETWVHLIWESTKQNPGVIQMYMNTTVSKRSLTLSLWNRIENFHPVNIAINPLFKGSVGLLRGWNRLLDRKEALALTLGYDICLDCPAFHKSLTSHASACSCVASPEKNVAKYGDVCACSPGYFDNYGVCELCPHGFYCTGQLAPKKCPPYTFSEKGAVSYTDCYCWGYMLDGECAECPADAVCATGESIKCAPPSIPSKNQTHCECPPGVGSVSHSGDCKACPAGTYSDSRDLSPCTACPAGKWSSPSATSCTFCAPGLYGDAGSCAQCPVGTYCPPYALQPFRCPKGTFGVKAGMATVQEACACQSGKGVYPSCECSTDSLVSLCTCPPGTYNVGGVCRECLEGSWCPGGEEPNYKCLQIYQSSPPASTEEASCVCDRGYYLSLAEGQCVGCPLHHYKNERGDGSCLPCPENALTYSIAADRLQACKCAPGYYSNVYNDHCTRCEEGYFCHGGKQYKCPANTFSEAGAIFRDECVCVPGYYHNIWLGKCVQCPRGTFKTTSGNEDCTACPPNTYNALPAQVSEDACLSCPSASMSIEGSLFDVSMCTVCPAGFYLRDGAVCMPCGKNETSVKGSTSCVCAAGFERLSNGICAPCPRGTYKAKSGDGGCHECGAGLYSETEGVSACTPCPHGTFKDVSGPHICKPCKQNAWHGFLGARSPTLCSCEKGFTASGGGCVPCPTNHFCPGRGVQRLCPKNTIALPPQASLDDCVCLPGHYKAFGNCIPCALSTYKDVTGNDACTPCPHKSVTDTRGASDPSQCSCPPGFQRENDLCIPCGVGYFSAAVSETCEPCHANSSTLLTRSRSQETCMCLPGFWEQKPFLCSKCREGFYCGFGDVPVACPPRTTSAEGSAKKQDCVCDSGYVRWEVNGEISCESCPRDHYCPGPDVEPVPCPVGRITLPGIHNNVVGSCLCANGMYYNGTADECIACPAFTTSLDGSECFCMDGFVLGDSACVPCPQDTFARDGVCTECSAGKTSSEGSSRCTCPYGFKETRKGGCVQCKPTDVCSEGSVTLSCPPLQVALSPENHNATGDVCACAAGYFRGNATQNKCEPCPLGSYKASPGSHACTLCKGVYTTRHAGATSEGMCACPAGSSLNVSGGVCTACPKGTYKTYSGTHECVSCVKGFTTKTEGAESADNCTPRKGVFNAIKERRIWGAGFFSRPWRVKSGKAYYQEEQGVLKMSSIQPTSVEFDVFADIFV